MEDLYKDEVIHELNMSHLQIDDQKKEASNHDTSQQMTQSNLKLMSKFGIADLEKEFNIPSNYTEEDKELNPKEGDKNQLAEEAPGGELSSSAPGHDLGVQSQFEMTRGTVKAPQNQAEAQRHFMKLEEDNKKTHPDNKTP